jgi:hypothetical protein
MKQKVKTSIALLTFIVLNTVLTTTFTIADDATETEVGIWWENYSFPYSLPYTDEDARSFSDNLVDDGWTEVYDRGNAQSIESHWVNSTHGGSDNSWVDDCDFVYWTGHGFPHKFITGNPLLLQDADIVNSIECTWGDDDLEWVFLNTCEALDDNTISYWDDVFQGLHGICGFDTTAYWSETYRLGNATANYLIAQTCIGGSWKQATEWFYEATGYENVVAACYSAKINRPGYNDFDYYYESTDGMWPDYGSGGITLDSLIYTDWDC